MALNRRSSVVLQVTLANKAGAYASGNQVGVPVELKGIVLESGSTATLTSVALLDPAAQNKSTDLLFFSQKPGTPGVDAGAVAVAAADLPFLLGVVNIPSTGYATLGTPSVGTVLNIGLKLKATKTIPAQLNSSVWVLAVTRSTPTYGAANSVQLQFGVDQD